MSATPPTDTLAPTPRAPRTEPSGSSPVPSGAERPRVEGCFLWAGREKFTVKGVTYGTFEADADGHLFPPRGRVRADFAAMAAAGFNTVRIYTAPPAWLLDEARAAGLRVLVGMFWESRDCNLEDEQVLREARDAVRSAVEACGAHRDVVLAYVIGNEIPALVVRFHGWRVVTRFLRELYDLVKSMDPDGLVTYGSFPPTEFLKLDFLDLYTFNVYLLERETLSAYLDRMMIETQGKPLLLGEVGDDSMHPGQQHQAQLLDWTLPLVLDKGVAGLCVFSWTDEWVVGGVPVEDWDFGLVDRQREPKPALEVAAQRMQEAPLERRREPWPPVSVVVCNYNGASTLDETLSSLRELDYPDFEAIYVDDGSTDESLEIARRHEDHVRIIAQENQGLSAARNVGARAATGTIVAYTDSDAFVDPEWLRFLVLAMESGDYVAAGGPNLTPASDGLDAQFIALCPGNPTVVLRDNVHADHIAGVNMAFRREALLSIDGFDPVHRKAGDDVDICWRLEDAGMKIAFSPAAIVWHHRRPSILRYLRQQYGYGEAENQLECKHRDRFNLAGQIRWQGRIYQAPRRILELFRPFIYHGFFGTAMFQTLYQHDPTVLLFGPAMIHWYCAWALLFLLAPLSLWLPAIGAVMLALSIWVALVQGLTTQVNVPLTRRQNLRKIWVVSLLHFVHPIVRTWGRLVPRRSARRDRVSVSPGEHFAELGRIFPRRKRVRRFWGVGSGDREPLLRSLRSQLKARGMSANFAQEWDNFDVCLDGSLLAAGRIYSAPCHYDQAISWGFRASTQHVCCYGILASVLLAAVGTILTPWVAAAWALPLVLCWRLLGRRAQMRAVYHSSLEHVMKAASAVEFDAEEGGRRAG